MRKPFLFLILTMCLCIVCSAIAEQGEDAFDSTQLAKLVEERIEVKESPDASAETMGVIEEKDTVIVLIDEVIQDDGGRWYRIYSNESGWGYIPEASVQKINYNTLTDWDIDSLYNVDPYLAVTREDNTKGYERPDEASQIVKTIPNHGTLVYLYSAYPGNSFTTGQYADSYDNWFYVMLPDHETYAFVKGTDLWLLDKLPVHFEEYFYQYLEPEDPVQEKTWQDAYLAVLKKYQAKITNMEKSRKYGNKKPVALWDINGDGINELLFVIPGKAAFEVEAYDDDGKPQNLSFTELLIYSYIEGQAVNLLHLTAPSADEIYAGTGSNEYYIRQTDKGMRLYINSSSYAGKMLIIDYSFDGNGFQELGKYHDLYWPTEGGGVIYGTLPVTLLDENNERDDYILYSHTGYDYEELPGLSLKEAREELKQ